MDLSGGPDAEAEPAVGRRWKCLVIGAAADEQQWRAPCFAQMWPEWWTGLALGAYRLGMGAKSRIEARYRAREARAKALEARAQRKCANGEDAVVILAAIDRVHQIDAWEAQCLVQARQRVRMEAGGKRMRCCEDACAAIGRMRDRGETLVNIATLVGVDVGEIRALIRHVPVKTRGTEKVSDASVDVVGYEEPKRQTPFAADSAVKGDLLSSVDDRIWPRCVRCDALMLVEDDRPRRGRRRLYCSDRCRRDASAARTAADRHGTPIRVVEVPRAVFAVQRNTGSVEPLMPAPRTALDAADITFHNTEALRSLLARVTECAQRKELDHATFTAARELAKAVQPHRS